MDSLLYYAINYECSDLHITEGKRAKMRINKTLVDGPDRKTDLSTINSFISAYLPELQEQYADIHKCKVPIDGAFEFADRRFRVNIYLSMDGVNVALRLLRSEIPNLEKLHLPESVQKFSELESGLVLVVGSNGSGKSTTLAAIIDSINRSQQKNILTVEQPVEYIHKPNKCRIEQIEVGVHVESFGTATVAAMRQNPDIILIGEIRDLPTIQNAITLAETGHLILATLHAQSVPDTVDRIIDVFPAGQQEQIRWQTAAVLKGVIHQRLVKTSNGMVPLVEVLQSDDVVAGMIRQKQKSNAIRDYMRGKSLSGNVHIADNAVWHCQNSRASIDELKNYMNPDDFNIAKSIVSHGRSPLGKERGFDV